MLKKEEAIPWPGTLAIVHSYIAYKAGRKMGSIGFFGVFFFSFKAEKWYWGSGTSWYFLYKRKLKRKSLIISEVIMTVQTLKLFVILVCAGEILVVIYWKVVEFTSTILFKWNSLELLSAVVTERLQILFLKVINFLFCSKRRRKTETT